MLSNDNLADNLISALKEKRTKVIIYDGSVKALPQPVQDYIMQSYVYSGQGNIYLLKQIQ
ncbi:MAG: 2 protein [Candidatus Poribacteria bacterium]|nr:2 protein [Candidatus Poribacteria bacterium]